MKFGEWDNRFNVQHKWGVYQGKSLAGDRIGTDGCPKGNLRDGMEVEAIFSSREKAEAWRKTWRNANFMVSMKVMITPIRKESK
jgi:hypothetical protein